MGLVAIPCVDPIPGNHNIFSCVLYFGVRCRRPESWRNGPTRSVGLHDPLGTASTLTVP